MEQAKRQIQNAQKARTFRARRTALAQRNTLLRLYMRLVCLRHALHTPWHPPVKRPTGWRREQRRSRNEQEKICMQCETPKPRKDFHKDVRQDDGRSPRCTICAATNQQTWLKQPGNRARTRTWATEQRLRNQGNEVLREYHRKKGKAWAQTHRDRIHVHERRSRLKRQQAVVIETVHIEVLYARDKGICSLCSKHVNAKLKFPHQQSGTVDHIIPLSRGGEESYRNTALAHLGCNIRKNNRSAIQQMRLF